MYETIGATRTARAVDNTDWLKTAAIILVAVDHFGYFFVEDNLWWHAFGRFAAPAFFFLLGYAQTRTVLISWVWLGVILTLLDCWNQGWTWMPPNILLSFVLIRLARPYVETHVRRYGRAALALLVLVLVGVVPITGEIVDYGAEGWLWALLGLCQRMHVDDKSVVGAVRHTAPLAVAMTANVGLMRLLVCFVTAVVYIWQQQRDFSFSQIQFVVLVVGVGILSAVLCLFNRGPSPVQPPEVVAAPLRFVGRHTLEIYAIQLGGSELITLLSR